MSVRVKETLVLCGHAVQDPLKLATLLGHHIKLPLGFGEQRNRKGS